ncbi:MAG: DUF4097 family beta strand repeat protein [Phycisphaeraceae bacterium]|nr:MAG: DUF4097 family beta strand repeat protein [Phycisphaeraceae bacterium]
MLSSLVRNTARWGTPALALGLALSAGCTTTIYQESRTVEVPHRPGLGLDAQTHNGALTARAATGEGSENVRINATIRARSRDRLSAVLVDADRDDLGNLVVRVLWPEPTGPRSAEGCDLVILIPDAVGVTLETHNGAITTGGLAGPLSARTSNGAIDVQAHAGPVNVKTSNGRIEIRGAAGPFEATTSNGAITLDIPDGSQGAFSLKTSNGAVTVTVPRDFAGSVTPSTSNGAITVVEPSGGPKEFTARKGNPVWPGGPASTISTSNGSITIRKRP